MTTLLDRELTKHLWLPLFWEPVAGTGERLMVGVLYQWLGEWQTLRLIRDDVLDSLYGRASGGARQLLETGMSLARGIAQAGGAHAMTSPVAGLHPGDVMETEAQSPQELVRIAALLYSSLANLDKLDELDEADAPLAEEVSRRFSTDVRERVLRRRPTLREFFNRSCVLVSGGQPVRFGFASPRAIMHFSVMHAVRTGPSMRDARARLLELASAAKVAQIPRACLISAVPRDDDATLGAKQQEQLRLVKAEAAREAESWNVELVQVHTADDAAERVVDLAA